MKYAAINGSTARFAFSDAKQVAWVATTNVDRGWAYRWVDERPIGWVNLNATALNRRMVVVTASLSPYAGSHWVDIWVDGTVGRPNIDIDGWIVARNL
jgi:hypothetical protein